jgi:solute carrier family 35 protein
MSKKEENEKTPLKKENNNTTQQKSNFINLGKIQISINVVFTYIYLLCSIFITVTNRKLYQKFNFKFSFTLMFLQQFFCSLLFFYGTKYSENFRKQSGEVSFEDFKKLKFEYFSFSLLFMMNIFSSFIGNQLVLNTAMYLILRKFMLIMNYLYDKLINKKVLPSHFSISVFLITSGSILSGLDDLTFDLLGYIIVFVNNSLSVIYGQFSEKFRKKNGVSNLKLLIYNSFLVTPILILMIIVSGELNRLIIYFQNSDVNKLFYLFINLVFSSFLCVLMNSCYFISNEKNSTLFTKLAGNCKDIFITGISMITLKDFKPTFNTLFGLFISTLGAFLFSFKALMDNIKIGNSEKIKDKNDKK